MKTFFTKDFWRFFFKTYKEAKWLLVRYVVVAIYLAASSIIANKMSLDNLTYFNAVLTLAYFSEMIGYGVVNGVSAYFNQNIKNKEKVNFYIKYGFKLSVIIGLVIIAAFAVCYKPILFNLLNLPETINLSFYFIMLGYIFLNTIRHYVTDVLKELKNFFKMLLLEGVHLLIIVGGFLTFWLSLDFNMNFIALIYILNSLVTIIYCLYFLKRNKEISVNLFSKSNLKITKKEFAVIFQIAGKELIWQVGYMLVAYFLLNNNKILFNQYDYFENSLDIFNGFLFAFINVTSIAISRKLGETNGFGDAYKIGKYSLYSIFIIWGVYAILSLSLSPLLISGMNIELQSTALIFMVFYVFMGLFRFLSWNFFSYILCWGGEIKELLWQEIFSTLYMIVIYTISFFVSFNIYIVFLFLTIPLIIQAIWGLYIFRNKKWMKKLSD